MLTLPIPSEHELLLAAVLVEAEGLESGSDAWFLDVGVLGNGDRLCCRRIHQTGQEVLVVGLHDILSWKTMVENLSRKDYAFPMKVLYLLIKVAIGRYPKAKCFVCLMMRRWLDLVSLLGAMISNLHLCSDIMCQLFLSSGVEQPL